MWALSHQRRDRPPQKIYNRGAEEFFCIDCSSRYLDVSVDLLRQKIVEFKKMGCTLFEA
ncbi:MAG: hypothetical protein ACLR2E_01075 [Lachnospiraceae bacterium]